MGRRNGPPEDIALEPRQQQVDAVPMEVIISESGGTYQQGGASGSGPGNRAVSGYRHIPLSEVSGDRHNHSTSNSSGDQQQHQQQQQWHQGASDMGPSLAPMPSTPTGNTVTEPEPQAHPPDDPDLATVPGSPIPNVPTSTEQGFETPAGRTRERSRSPPPGRHSQHIVDENANHAYLAHLLGHGSSRKKMAKRYIPSTTIAKDSLDFWKASKNKWLETEFDFSVDFNSADIEFFATETDSNNIDDHLAYMAWDTKRNAEVSLKWRSKADRAKKCKLNPRKLINGTRMQYSR